MLARGELPWGCDYFRCCPSHRLFDRYVRHAGRQGARRKAIETQIGMFLANNVPGLRRNHRGWYKIFTKAGMVVDTCTTYEFPALTECRKAFADAMQHNIAWSEKADWTHADRRTPTTRSCRCTEGARVKNPRQ